MKPILTLVRTLLLVEASLLSHHVEAITPTNDPFESPGLLQDVISSIDNPLQYEWRRNDVELSLGYGYSDEQNNFESEVFEFGLGLPQRGGQIIRFNFRLIDVSETASSKKLGRTPFTQEATVRRYEIGLSFLYALMEGKQITRFSPAIPDLETVLLGVAGIHFAQPNRNWKNPIKRDVETFPGMSPVTYKYGLELGLEWQVFLPSSFGLKFGWYQHIFTPPGDDLASAPFFMTGVIWGVR
jgi:hypothetical protein